MNIVGLLVSCAAAVSLWVGASRQDGGTARGYRWLAGTAVFWFAGLLADQLFAGSFGGSGPLSLADVAPLLAMGPLVVGVIALAAEPPEGGWREGTEASTVGGAGLSPGPPSRPKGAGGRAPSRSPPRVLTRARSCPRWPTATSWPSRCWSSAGSRCSGRATGTPARGPARFCRAWGTRWSTRPCSACCCPP